jgi:dephospho-CoA kinase
MIIVGLTGSLGSGKSTVARMFAKLGSAVIDADQVVHHELKSTGRAFKKVVRTFGTEILAAGEIDRRKLADIVFHDPAKLKALTSIVHPIAEKEVRSRIRTLRKGGTTRLTVVDAPLLLEAGWQKWVDYVIVVRASKDLQARRLKSQRYMKGSDIDRRLKMQLPMQTKINMADIVIDNRKSLNETEKQTRVIAQRLLGRAK